MWHNCSGLESMLHMTCVGNTKEEVTKFLHKAKNLGIRNILGKYKKVQICWGEIYFEIFSALRGDLPNVDEKWTFDTEKLNFASDMVKHIR